MRIGYFADGPWGHLTLETILQDSTIEVAFIVPRNDTQDDWLKNKASTNGIDYLCPIIVNSDEFYSKAKEYNCDLFVSMSYNQIFRKRIFSLPQYTTINCHAGKLPYYRGRNILNWALINDEKEFGITVHYVDGGIDTGDIIIQQIYPIADNDDYSSLLQVAYKECPKLLYRAIKEIQNGIAKKIPQEIISSNGLYCGMRKSGDEIIEWNSTSRELFNFVRAICKPGPMALTYCNGASVYINKVNYDSCYPKYKGIAGQILAIADAGPIVKTQDSFVIILDYLSDIKLKVGDRLSSRK